MKNNFFLEEPSYKKCSLFLILSIALLSYLTLISGEFNIHFSDFYLSIINYIKNNNLSLEQSILLNIRLPKLLSALMSGGVLALSGLLMQIYFSNALAGPFVLGIHSGASLFVALFLMADNILKGIVPQMIIDHGVVLFSILGSGLSLFILFIVNLRIKTKVVLLVVGLLLSHISSGIINFLVVLSPSSKIKNYLLWTQGSFSRLSLDEVPFFFIISFISILFIFKIAKELNLLLMGEGYAKSMGANIPLLKWKLIVITGVLVGTVTAFCGPISFVGILGPHFARIVFGTNNSKVLIPGSLLIGSFLTLFVSYLLTFSYFSQLPINTLFGIIGAPFIIYLILKRRSDV